MRKFNSDKELYKIQHGNRNKVLYGIIALLLIISIGSTYALYQVRYSKRIIYTKVAPFNNKDIELAIYLDGSPSIDDFPVKNSGYRYDHMECDNGSIAEFNTVKWSLVLYAKKKDKCNVYFVKNNEPNVPELYQGLIPIVYDESGNISVADTNSDWYDYDDKRWANAVLVNSTNYSKYVKNGEYISNKTIPIEEILQMYVWIPRYKYQLFNANYEGVEPQEIQIQFEAGISSTGEVTCEIDAKGKETCENAENGAWYTHPAFTFGNTDLTGIWVGKFEPSGNESQIKIIPNAVPIINKSASYMFSASRNIELTYFNNFNLNKNEIDTHVMRNMDWGAMAYLTQSKYGRCDGQGECTVVTKNSVEFGTGYATSSQPWNTSDGQKASTTENMYGIYDTNGGAWDFIMALIANNLGVFNLSTGGLTSVDEKYYDKYEYGTSDTDPQRGHLGDATRETLQMLNNSDAGAWYDGYSYFPNPSSMWVQRGGRGSSPNNSIFTYYRHVGSGGGASSFRIVLTAQDGEN